MVSKSYRKCFGNPFTKEECNSCKDAIECIISLYDKPRPTLVLYSVT